MAKIIRRFSDSNIQTRMLQAVSDGEHYGAWSLPDGREVLLVGDDVLKLWIWSPDGAVREADIDTTTPTNVCVRQVDTGERPSRVVTGAALVA